MPLAFAARPKALVSGGEKKSQAVDEVPVFILTCTSIELIIHKKANMLPHIDA
jgi:aspartate/glutamate racemase